MPTSTSASTPSELRFRPRCRTTEDGGAAASGAVALVAQEAFDLGGEGVAAGQVVDRQTLLFVVHVVILFVRLLELAHVGGGVVVGLEPFVHRPLVGGGCDL